MTTLVDGALTMAQNQSQVLQLLHLLKTDYYNRRRAWDKYRNFS